MTGATPRFNELYDQLLSSFGDEGPDLNLTSPIQDDRRPPRERKETSDSDKLLDIYHSYTERETPPPRDSNAVPVPNAISM